MAGMVSSFGTSDPQSPDEGSHVFTIFLSGSSPLQMSSAGPGLGGFTLNSLMPQPALYLSFSLSCMQHEKTVRSAKVVESTAPCLDSLQVQSAGLLNHPGS